MASIYQEVDRLTNQYAQIGSGVTLRPDRHSGRARRLGESRASHPQPKHEGPHKGLLKIVRASGERAFIRLYAPRPRVPERIHLAEELAAVEIPRVIREVIVVDFSAGVDEAVVRQDAFEGEYKSSHDVLKAPVRRDWVKEVMGRAKDSGRSFVRDLKMGMDMNSQARARRSSRAGA